MAEVEADAEQRRVVAKSMHRIPDTMNIKEGYNLLILLYKVGILFDYNTALDAADDDTGRDENGYMIDFDEDFNLDDEKDIVIHSETGMITSLQLCRLNSYDDSDSDEDDNDDGDDNLGLYLPIDVPPIIDQLQSLESIDLRNCRLLPKELGNLPLLKTIELHFCPRMYIIIFQMGFNLLPSKKLTLVFIVPNLILAFRLC